MKGLVDILEGNVIKVMKTQIIVSFYPINHPLPRMYLEGLVEFLYNAASETLYIMLVERSGSRLNVLK